MSTCNNCKFMREIGDKDVLINECRRKPPVGNGTGLSHYPLIKNNNPACGEFQEVEAKKEKKR